MIICAEKYWGRKSCDGREARCWKGSTSCDSPDWHQRHDPLLQSDQIETRNLCNQIDTRDLFRDQIETRELCKDHIGTRDTTLCKVVHSFTLHVPDDSQQLPVYIWNRKRVGWYFTQDKDVPHRTHAEALCRLYRAFEDSQGPFKTSSTPHSVTFDLVLFNKYLWFDPLQLGHLTQHHER